jgi:hypothetical protein
MVDAAITPLPAARLNAPTVTRRVQGTKWRRQVARPRLDWTGACAVMGELKVNTTTKMATLLSDGRTEEKGRRR